jgi:hypothetical protein
MKLSCQQIRHVVKARGHLLDGGYDWSDPVIEGLSAEIEEYRREVGVNTYVSQMLDNAHRCAIEMCILRWPDGRTLHGKALGVSRVVQAQRCFAWIVDNCRPDNLPYKLEADLGAHKAVRYL